MAAIYKEKAGREGRKPEIGTRQSTYNGDWYASFHVQCISPRRVEQHYCAQEQSLSEQHAMRTCTMNR